MILSRSVASGEPLPAMMPALGSSSSAVGSEGCRRPRRSPTHPCSALVDRRNHHLFQPLLYQVALRCSPAHRVPDSLGAARPAECGRRPRRCRRH